MTVRKTIYFMKYSFQVTHLNCPGFKQWAQIKKIKFRVFSLLVLLLMVSYSWAQKNEYQYIGLRFGAIHGFSGQPEMNPNKYLLAPGVYDELTQTTAFEEMQLSPLSKYLGYTPGFNASLLYHFDFRSDNGGIFTGLDYNFSGISSKYETTYATNHHTLKETHRMHMVGLPIAVKYGPKIWDTQRYVFGGVQVNYIVAMNAVQKVDWNTTPSSTKLESGEYKKINFSIFFGFNYSAFNVQFDFYPKSIFDKTYTVSDPVTGGDYLKYDGQVEKFFTIKTSINIPYGWLSEQSFWWRRKLRKFPLWK